jgi:hypothetical protein
VHEYILIFAKPALTKTKGPKVKPYSELMAGMNGLASGEGMDPELRIPLQS